MRMLHPPAAPVGGREKTEHQVGLDKMRGAPPVDPKQCFRLNVIQHVRLCIGVSATGISRILPAFQIFDKVLCSLSIRGVGSFLWLLEYSVPASAVGLDCFELLRGALDYRPQGSGADGEC